MDKKIKYYVKKIFFKRSRNKQTEEVIPVKDLFYTKNQFDGKKFLIGDFTYGSPAIIFENPDANLIIGKYCSIADDVTIFLGGNHRTDWITTYPFNSVPTNDFSDFRHLEGHPATKGDVLIGNDVWIGLKSTILSGVSIGNGAVIAAGSVVTKDIGPYEIWGGNPARFIKKRFNDDQIKNLLSIGWWNWPDSIVKKNITLLCNDNINEFINQNS